MIILDHYCCYRFLQLHSIRLIFSYSSSFRTATRREHSFSCFKRESEEEKENACSIRQLA